MGITRSIKKFFQNKRKINIKAGWYYRLVLYKLFSFLGFRSISHSLQEELVDYYEIFYHNKELEGVFLLKYFPSLYSDNVQRIINIFANKAEHLSRVKKIGYIIETGKREA